MNAARPDRRRSDRRSGGPRFGRGPGGGAPRSRGGRPGGDGRLSGGGHDGGRDGRGRGDGRGPGEAPLALTNPHAVLAALRARPGAVVELRLPPAQAARSGEPGGGPRTRDRAADGERGGPGERGGVGGAWREAAAAAVAAGVPVRPLPPPEERTPGARRGGDRSRPRGEAPDGRGSAAYALVRPRPVTPLDALFAHPAAGDRWLALDQVQDPRNVGSIVRTAAFFGVRGLLVTADRAAPLSAAVYDTAAGGMEFVPVAVEANLRQALAAARRAGVWVIGADEHGETSTAAVDRARPWLLVAGNEERGIRRLTREACDEVVRLQPRGELATLNVSVAVAVLLGALDPGAGA